MYTETKLNSKQKCKRHSTSSNLHIYLLHWLGWLLDLQSAATKISASKLKYMFICRSSFVWIYYFLFFISIALVKIYVRNLVLHIHLTRQDKTRQEQWHPHLLSYRMHWLVLENKISPAGFWLPDLDLLICCLMLNLPLNIWTFDLIKKQWWAEEDERGRRKRNKLTHRSQRKHKSVSRSNKIFRLILELTHSGNIHQLFRGSKSSNQTQRSQCSHSEDYQRDRMILCWAAGEGEPASAP